jgi:hypothetical protein
MSIHGGKMRGQKRQLIGDDSQLVDIRKLLIRQLESCTVVSHEDSQYELNTQ